MTTLELFDEIGELGISLTDEISKDMRQSVLLELNSLIAERIKLLQHAVTKAAAALTYAGKP